MTYPTPEIGGIPYFPLPDGWEPYHYTDEARVIPLLGRDPVLPDRNEIIQSNARGGESSVFSALCETEADADALVELTHTVQPHDDGTGAPIRDVAVLLVTKAMHSWGGAAPIWVVTLKTRTVTVVVE